MENVFGLLKKYREAVVRFWNGAARLLLVTSLFVGMAVPCVGALPRQAQASPNVLLAKAVEANDLAGVEAGLAQGAFADTHELNSNNPVSCLAAWRGQTAILKALLEHGARADTRTSLDHLTLLMCAAHSAQADAVALFLAYKVKVNLQDVRGTTALMMVGDAEILRMLVNTGADKELRDKRGRTALLVYADYGIRGGVEFLADAGAKVNARDREGNTPLILASGWEQGDMGILNPEGRLAIVKFLLKRGADLRAKNHAGTTALMAASKHGYPEIVALLQKYTATGQNWKKPIGQPKRPGHVEG
jgi:ankyrin repeat protein